MPSSSLRFRTVAGVTGFQKLLGKPHPASPNPYVYSGIKMKKMAKQSISDAIHKRVSQAHARPAPWLELLAFGPTCVAHTNLVQQYFLSLFFGSSLFLAQEEVEKLLESGGLELKSWLCHLVRRWQMS